MKQLCQKMKPLWCKLQQHGFNLQQKWCPFATAWLQVVSNCVSCFFRMLLPLLRNGFSRQAYADLHVVRVCCLVQRYAGTASVQAPAQQLPHDLMTACCESVDNKSLLSPRLTSLFKVIHGPARQLGRTSWDMMVSMARNTTGTGSFTSRHYM